MKGGPLKRTSRVMIRTTVSTGAARNPMPSAQGKSRITIVSSVKKKGRGQAMTAQTAAQKRPRCGCPCAVRHDRLTRIAKLPAPSVRDTGYCQTVRRTTSRASDGPLVFNYLNYTSVLELSQARSDWRAPCPCDWGNSRVQLGERLCSVWLAGATWCERTRFSRFGSWRRLLKMGRVITL